MRISKRTHLEIGAVLVLMGICIVLVAAFRFEAFVDSDQRFRKEFEPYLITQAMRNPVSSEDNYRMFVYRDMVYGFYPSGSAYSRCSQMLVCSSGGLTAVALGAWICLRARRRREVWR